MTDVQKPVGVALLGCGRVSDAHLEAISMSPKYGRLEAVIDTELSRAEAAAKKYKAPRVFTSLDEALAIDSVEAIIVCLPNHLHEEASITALNAGRHVLVEKPMADDAKGAMLMGEAARTNDRLLAVGQSRRHTKAVRYVHDNLESFGKLRSLHECFCCFWDGPQTPWWSERDREAGLVLSLISTHSMDFVQMIMGNKDPIRVHVESTRYQSGWKADDEAMIILKYSDNKLVFIHLSYNQNPIYDSKSLLFDGSVVQIQNNLEVWENGKLILSPEPGEESEMARPSLQFVWQFEEFSKAVRGLPNRSVMHSDGVRQMRVLDAIRKAAITGEVVCLN